MLLQEPNDADTATTTSSAPSVPDTPTAADARVFVNSELPYFLTSEFIGCTLGFDDRHTYDMQEAIRRLEVIFSSAACINGSLIMK